MFDYSLVHWTTFLSAALLLNLAPGPDITFILGRTVQGGRGHGFAAMLGVWTGAAGHAVMAALGLSAVLATSATAFTIVKWVGAAYLVWLGLRALAAGGEGFAVDRSALAPTPAAVYRQGVLVSLLNPKVATFFLAFLPQFVVEGAGPVSAQLLLHGLLIIAVAALVEPPLVLAGARFVRHLRENPRVARWLERALGGLLVGFGVKLAFTRS